jgi:hypothetical protein
VNGGLNGGLLLKPPLARDAILPLPTFGRGEVPCQPEDPMPDRAPRLGDVIDDYCPRCRLLLNHDVTSLFANEVAKVTCRTCHNTHDYRHAQVPPRRKSAKKEDKKSLMEQVLASMPMPPEPPPPKAPEPRTGKRDLWAEIERIKAQKKGSSS